MTEQYFVSYSSLCGASQLVYLGALFKYSTAYEYCPPLKDDTLLKHLLNIDRASVHKYKTNCEKCNAFCRRLQSTGNAV